MAHHFAAPINIPVYSLAWTSDDTFVLGGGGGTSATGVKNRISRYRVHPSTRTIERTQQYDLSAAEDVPMTLAVHEGRAEVIAGINSSKKMMDAGVNVNLRVFSFDDEQGWVLSSPLCTCRVAGWGKLTRMV